MDLRQKQDHVFESLSDVRNKVSVVTPVEDFASDNRLCLTLVHFPAKSITSQIMRIITRLKKADPRQYYYDETSLHATINNIRVISNPAKYSISDIEKVSKLKLKPKLFFDINGLLLMKKPGSILLKLYPDEQTNDFILKLRLQLAEIGVLDDKIYADTNTIISNITFCRFTTEPNNKFYKILEKADIKGKIEVKKISLISCNAVCQNRTIHKEFS